MRWAHLGLGVGHRSIVRLAVVSPSHSGGTTASVGRSLPWMGTLSSAPASTSRLASMASSTGLGSFASYCIGLLLTWPGFGTVVGSLTWSVYKAVRQFPVVKAGEEVRISKQKSYGILFLDSRDGHLMDCSHVSSSWGNRLHQYSGKLVASEYC